MKIKNLSLLTAIIVVLFITACGGEKVQEKKIEKVLERNDINEMKELKGELSVKQHSLADQLNQLTKAIDAMDSNKSIPLVSIYDLVPRKFKHYIEVQANFNADKNIELFAEYNGVLTEILVKEGESVKKGQLLARIDDGGLSKQLVQAEVQEELTKITFERQKKLWDQNIGSEMQYLQAKANYKGQNKMVEQLRAQLGKTNIIAPFSGVVDEILIEAGNMVSAGGMSGIMRLINLDEVYAKAEVPENYIKTIKKGTAVNVIVPVLRDTIPTTISQVGNYIKPDNRTFRVEAAVVNKDWEIKPNMNAKLSIVNYSTDTAIVIPQNVISEDAEGNKYVYLIEDKNGDRAKVKRVFIEIGKAEGSFIEVLKGLKAGSQILDEGARTVVDGQTVEILK